MPESAFRLLLSNAIMILVCPNAIEQPEQPLLFFCSFAAPT